MQLNHLVWWLGLSLTACGPAPAPASSADTEPRLVSQTNPADTLPFPVFENFDELAPLLARNNDTTYVVNFWATWCKPCVEELPYFEQLAQETAQQPVQILMVSLDFKRDIHTKLQRFVRERPLELPVIALADGRYNEWIDRVDTRWGGAIPATVVFRGDDRAFVERQFASYAELSELVQTVMQKN